MIPDRPHAHDDNVCNAVAAKLLPEVLAYLEQKEDKDGEVLKQLAETLIDSHEYDGYDLTKKLEDDHYWEGSEELVDIMGSAGHHAYKICSDMVREWVKTNNIKPGHKVDDVVEWNRFNKYWREMKRGVIVEVREDEAVYVIQEEGKDYTPNIPKNLPKDVADKIKEHKGGWVVGYEQVTDDQPWWTAERHAGKFFKPETEKGSACQQSTVLETDTKSAGAAAAASSSS